MTREENFWRRFGITFISHNVSTAGRILRAMTPRRLLEWYDSRSDVCWAQLSSWRDGFEFGTAGGDDCKKGLVEEPGCWCGKYRPQATAKTSQ